MSQSKPRGFAALTPERREEISRLGGKAAHAQGKAHQFDNKSGQAAALKAQKNKKEREKAAGSCEDEAPVLK